MKRGADEDNNSTKNRMAHGSLPFISNISRNKKINGCIRTENTAADCF